MDVLPARPLRLALALLSATALACASSEESSFSQGPGLSAGHGGSNATEASSTSGTGTSDSSASDGGSNSGSNSGTSTGTPGTGDPTSAGPGTGDTESPTTTGLDCDNGLGSLCGTPYDLGSLAEGEMALSQTSTIVTTDVADWFQVGFPAVNRPGGGTPSISFAQNDDDAFRFDVFTGMPCGGEAVSCGEGGDDNGEGTNLVEYSFTDDQPDCCEEPDEQMVAWPGVLYIRVYRVDGGQSCSAYQLTLSR